MLRKTFAHEPRCLIDDSEVLQDGPSWTICTLERLQNREPDASHLLIVGADALLGLTTWHRWHELLDYAHIAVANRPGIRLDLAAMPEALRAFWTERHTGDLAKLRQQHAGFVVSFTITPCEVSATRVRQALAQGEAVDTLITPAVENYIKQHHLYTQTAD